MNFEEAFNLINAKNLKGWMGREDCMVLYDHASKINNGLILEIGCFMGRSSLMMALASPTSQVVSIDPFLTVHSSSGETDPLFVRDRCIEALKGQNWQLIQDKSQNVGKTWQKPIDLLFIDGDHHYTALIKDLELFTPHVKRGGFIILHDYTVSDGVEESGSRVKEAGKDFFGDQVKTEAGCGVIQK